TAGGYLEELRTLLSGRREQALERNRELDERVFDAARDPRITLVPPGRADVPPFLNFAPLENAVEMLRESAERYEAASDKAQASGFSGLPLAEINGRLLALERTLSSPEGLPRRPWFRHLLYAPGFYTGYGVKTIPGVREAIEQGDWKEADGEIVRVAERVKAAAAAIADVARLLEKP
ncbi:MAG TPA: transferrin receptor-like dimerization domain-containing protein, partial [Gemmatimonadales bacterium]